MASRPKRTLAKRYNRMAQALLKDIVVVFVAGQNNGVVQVWDRKRKAMVKIQECTARAIHEGRFPWMVHCAVTGRRQDGQEYSKLEYLPAPHPVTQAQIAESCSEKHLRIIDTMNPQHTLTAAWVASPRGDEWTRKR
jgi:hypothetical protein